MKLKIYLVAFVLISIFGVCNIAAAQTAMTDAQRQALIIQIENDIARLQVQINALLAQQQGTSSWCHTFYNNLGVYNSGSSEVFNLHIALQKSGMIYIPDGVNDYSSGTTQAVVAFQTKYKISPATGYVGDETRAKLNSLYGCGGSTGATCKPNWQCSNWGLCLSGDQIRNCTDANNCGVNTNEPKLSQTCTVQPAIQIQANGSYGPVNIFVKLNDGASVTSSGIMLSQNINLQWNGIEVDSCVASDNMKPSIFSGYKSYSGSQLVTLLKTTPISSGGNRVSDTFKITCVSITNGASVSGSVTVNLFYSVASNCTANWECNAWTACTGSYQTRTCIDWNGCGSTSGEPLLKESCVDLPKVNIKANNSEGPLTIVSGQPVTLSWSSSSATSCVASGNWSGTQNTGGSVKITALTGTNIYIITCTNSAGSNIDSVSINGT